MDNEDFCDDEVDLFDCDAVVDGEMCFSKEGKSDSWTPDDDDDDDDDDDGNDVMTVVAPVEYKWNQLNKRITRKFRRTGRLY